MYGGTDAAQAMDTLQQKILKVTTAQ
jgi:hypothetical protein